MLEYEWYGNIRELLSVVERAVILSEGSVIEVKDLFLEPKQAKTKKENKIANLESELITEVLKDCSGDMERAAQMLGMQIDVLRHKVVKYQLG